MKILVVTPLYPPDIAPLAVYVKELASRLEEQHKMTVLCYAKIPEVVHGVSIVPVSKNNPALIRLFAFTRALLRIIRKNDYVYVQNGPSVELPMIVVSYITRRPIVYHLSDTVAYREAHASRFFGYVSKKMQARATHIVYDEKLTPQPEFKNKSTLLPNPLPRPEILPFSAYPHEAFTAYETTWSDHLTALAKHFSS